MKIKYLLFLLPLFLLGIVKPTSVDAQTQKVIIDVNQRISSFYESDPLVNEYLLLGENDEVIQSFSLKNKASKEMVIPVSGYGDFFYTLKNQLGKNQRYQGLEKSYRIHIKAFPSEVPKAVIVAENSAGLKVSELSFDYQLKRPKLPDTTQPIPPTVPDKNEDEKTPMTTPNTPTNRRKRLPQTGEQVKQSLFLIGSLLVGSSLILVILKRRNLD